MKELSIKEKAKRYDEAIERVNSKWKYKNQPCVVNIAEIFPELKESEDGIRKALIKFHKSTIDIDGIKGEDILAWLEKQGEQEHVIAPKFDIGDIIRNKITNEVFTITDRCISLEYYHDINHLHEVKFSEQDNWELVKHKPAWSEEDESEDSYFELTQEAIEGCYTENNPLRKELITWLKSIKERYIRLPSNEQIEVCKKVYADILSAGGFDLATINGELNRLEEQLKQF